MMPLTIVMFIIVWRCCHYCDILCNNKGLMKTGYCDSPNSDEVK